MDYYQKLGVDKTASAAEIKKAFRKIAVKYHPDKNPDDKAAEDKFKEANEAYAVLSDPEKKQQYDTYGEAGFSQRYSQEDIFRGSNLGDIFKEFGINFGGGGGGFQQGGGGSPFDSFFSQGGGGGCGGGCGTRQAAPKGQDTTMDLWVTLEEVSSGTERTVAAHGSEERVSVKIPKGIEAGKKLRLTGKGQQSPHGGQPGNLYLRINIQPHSEFERKDNNLIVKCPVTFSEAVLGTTVTIPTLEGGELNVKIPPGMQTKAKLRLKGKGLPSANGSDRGDILVQIVVDIPKELSEEQIKIVEELQGAGL